MSGNFLKWLEQNQIAQRTAYNLMKLAGSGEEEREEQSGSSKRKQAEQERIQAGLRLIEVRNRMLRPGQQRCPDFVVWYEQNGIAQSTVSRLMTLAGDTPEQREEKKAKDRERKRDSRRATVGRRRTVVGLNS